VSEHGRRINVPTLVTSRDAIPHAVEGNARQGDLNAGHESIVRFPALAHKPDLGRIGNH
jgi:hypothetical protein